jgi:hypothetical protein
MALPACAGDALTTGSELMAKDGDAGGRGAGGRGPGTDGSLSTTCVAQNPEHESDPPEVPLEIDATWCNAAHTCAMCRWRFAGVGIYVAGQPDANCTLPSFICPATLGGAAVDGGVRACPAAADFGTSDQATIDFDGYSWTPFDCKIIGSAHGGWDVNVTSCQLGGFTCATSCASCP